MTELYTDVITIVNGGTNSRSDISAKYNSRKRVQMGTVELSGAAQGDTIVVAKLPMGSILLPSSTIFHDGLGTDSTLSVGISGDTDFYATTTPTVSAGNFNCDVMDGLGTEMETLTDIIVTCVGDESYTGTLTSVIEYSWI